MYEGSGGQGHARNDREDRVRVIEILQKHYSPENVLLTQPTTVQIYRSRTGKREAWEVVLWNVKAGQYLAWRREQGLKARPIDPDEEGLVGGVSIVVPNRPPAQPTLSRPEPKAVEDREVDEEFVEELAAEYLKKIERRLTDSRRGSLDPYGGSIDAALRNLEEGMRMRREQQEREQAE